MNPFTERKKQKNAMKTTKPIIAAAFLFLIVLTSICDGAGPAEPGPEFTVLFFNDMHGHLSPFSVKTGTGTQEVGGVARVAALIKSIRTENDQKGVKTFVLIAGDILQGTPMSTIFHGEPDIACFNRMGVNAAAVGNHEFDFGLENFLTLRKHAAFPFISANIRWKESGKPLVDGSVSLGIDGDLHLTVIGVTTMDLMTTTSPVNVNDIAVDDPVGATVAAYRRARPRGPVILLSHSRHQTDRDIAAALPDLAAIIGGHDQILLAPHRLAGRVPVFQAFEKGRYLGRLDFQVNPRTGSAVLKNNSYIAVNTQIPADPEIQAIVDQYAGRMDSKFNEVIGRTDVFLDGERERIRSEETTLGNFVTDVMRRHTGSQIALLNAGSLRASINSGEITVADVFRAMPYANELVTVSLTGKELAQALARSVQGKKEEEDGGFLHVSGLQVTVSGQKTSRITTGPGHIPLDPDRTYTVVITDFLYSGGDGYGLFKDKMPTPTGLPLRELLVDEIKSRKVVHAELEGRIVRDDR